MKLKITPRNEYKKSLTRSLRREGNIPAIVYSSSGASRAVTVDGSDFMAALRHLKKGHLPNTLFSLEESKGKGTTFCQEVIVKDIQYHKVTYQVLHLDFFELSAEQPVTLNIPVEMIGQADCVGVKAGGALRLVKRHLSVRCLPKYIPQQIELHVIDLQIKESKRVRNLPIQEHLEILAGPNEVLAVVGKR